MGQGHMTVKIASQKKWFQDATSAIQKQNNNKYLIKMKPRKKICNIKIALQF